MVKSFFCVFGYTAEPVVDGTQVFMGLLLRRIQLSLKTRNGSWKFLAVYLCNCTVNCIKQKHLLKR